MKYLIKPTFTKGTTDYPDCNSYTCMDYNPCLGLCGTKCPLNKYLCYKPGVQGLSPTGSRDEEQE